MTQEKSPEDEAFDAITQSQMKKATGAEVVKELMRPFEEAMQEMVTDALLYGTGRMKVSMNNEGRIEAETIRYRDAFPVDRNEVLEEVAAEFDKMSAFGDTAASFAVFVRAMKN